MNAEAQKSRVRVLVVASLAAFLFACDKGIPGPRVALTDNSSDSAFYAYGETLQFATSAPGLISVNRTVNGAASTLQIASEVRLPKTKDADYTGGRIIAKFVTGGATSGFGTPVGTAYLWVKANGANKVGTLIWRNSATGAMGRVVVQQEHLAAAHQLKDAECDDMSPSAVGDTIIICCMCGGHWNCPMYAAMGRIDPSYVQGLLRARGK